MCRSLPALLLALAACSAMLAAGAPQQGTSSPPGSVPPTPPPPPAVAGRGEQPRVQQIPIGNGQIAGTVTASDSGRPLRDVMVTLQGASDGPSVGRTAAAGAAAGGLAGLASMVPGAGGAGLPLTRSATTDAQGAFLFDNLPQGRFTIAASRSGFLATNYGARAYGRAGRTIALGPNQRVAIEFGLLRSSVISGFVSGEDGEPLGNARVQVYRYGFVNNAKRVMTSSGALTDDRGAYRVTGLQPGDYLVSVTPNNFDLVQSERALAEQQAFEAALAARNGAPTDLLVVTNPTGAADYTFANFAPTYYPGAPGPTGASAVSLGAGEERPGVDIRAQSWRTVTIRGTVNLPEGFPFGVQISLQGAEPEFAGLFQSSIRANADGSFLLRSIPPGTYLVSAQTSAAPITTIGAVPTGGQQFVVQPPRQPQPHEMMWGRAVVSVDGRGAPSVSVDLHPSRSVSGQLVLPAGAPRPSQTVSLQPTTSLDSFMNRVPGAAQVQPDGRFRIDGVMPGRYVFRAGALKSAVVGGVETLDFPLEVTGEQDVAGAVLTPADRVSQLTGRILEANGEPAYDYTIIVIPDDPRYWVPGSRRIAAARAGANGNYTFGGLPAGGYYLAALADLEAGAQYDPTFLRDLARAAMRVTIADGQRQVQDIRVR